MARFIAKWAAGIVLSMALFIIWQVWSVIPVLAPNQLATSAAAAAPPVPAVLALAPTDNSKLLAINLERSRGQRQEVFRRLIHDYGRLF